MSNWFFSADCNTCHVPMSDRPKGDGTYFAKCKMCHSERTLCGAISGDVFCNKDPSHAGDHHSRDGTDWA